MAVHNDRFPNVAHDTALASFSMPPTVSPAERQADPRVERTRAAVLEAAAGLLTTVGPSALTHANVATAANISRTTVYAHWPTIADLLHDTIESLAKWPIGADQLSGDLRTDLGLLCNQIATNLRDEQRAAMILSMMERAMHDTDVAAVRNEFLGMFAGIFTTVIRTAIERDELRRDIDIDRSIASLVGGLLFARFMSPTGLDASFVDTTLDDFVHINAPR